MGFYYESGYVRKYDDDIEYFLAVTSLKIEQFMNKEAEKNQVFLQFSITTHSDVWQKHL